MVDPSQGARPAQQYVLGHSEHEVERLKAQARLIDPITERFFLAAGDGHSICVSFGQSGGASSV